MVSGRETLANIDTAVTEARRKIAALDDQIEDVNRRLAKFRTEQTEDLKELARARIALIADPELVQRLDQAEHQVLALLAQRDAALKELESQLADAETGERELEQQRQEQAARVDAAAEAVDAAEAKTQARLDADPAYAAQREAAHEAERIAMHADEKATRSEDEREQKGAAYRADPLFMYLWDRNFGLPAYKAWGLTRMLDNWVARLIGFADARANYSRLSEIPERLREHAAGVKASADQEFAALKALDEQAREEDGVPALEAVVATEQEQLDAIDGRIAAAEADHQGLMVKKALFASGDDSYTRQAVEFLAGELARDDLMELRREALQTPLPDDDLIVGRMLTRADERRRIEGSVPAIKQTAQQQHQRLTELEAVRADFKRSRYDRAGSTFGDEAMIAMMLTQFLNGMLDRQNLWRVIKEQQRYSPQYSDPSFGSGGFGRGTVWGGGVGDLRDLGDIVGGFGRGGFGRGGFGRGGMGGGFSGGGGGGGFRTGGGF